MTENSIIVGGGDEDSFFAGISIRGIEISKGQKDVAGNSSNPEKIYEK